MMEADIVVKGAREHNLRGVNLTLPRGKLIVFTGVSGSGKSSLAFDTLYAEGRRRYVESLSSYARRFLGTQEKPDVDHISGLAPTISIQQKTAADNPRSTVGTVTQIHDYLRVLFSRLGTQHCPTCGKAISAQTRDQILGRILALPEGTKFHLLAPVVRGQKGEYKDLFEDLLKQGFVRARVDGTVASLHDKLRLDKMVRHNIEVVIDRLAVGPTIRPRLAEAVELGLKLGEGVVIVSPGDSAEPKGDLLLSSQYACLACDRSFEMPSPQLLSFNSPQGMCMMCDGLGIFSDFEPDLLIPDAGKSFANGAIVTHSGKIGREKKLRYESAAAHVGLSLKMAWKDIDPEKRKRFLYGTGDEVVEFIGRRGGGRRFRYRDQWEGIIGELRAVVRASQSEMVRKWYGKYQRSMLCPSCAGARLNPQAKAVMLAGKSIVDVCGMSILDCRAFFECLPLSPLQLQIGGDAVREVVQRLGFLLDVGLDYLSLDRSAPTLSGGEAQRIRLAGQVGCGLVGVLYILDEPSIGLHPRDNTRLIGALQKLRDIGNTVIVVEHDEETMRAADLIVDFGPGPGVKGGEVVFAGTWDQLTGAGKSLTADYLTGRREIAVPKERRPVPAINPEPTAAPKTKAAPKSKVRKAVERKIAKAK